jgi:hypothetical protein
MSSTTTAAAETRSPLDNERAEKDKHPSDKASPAVPTEKLEPVADEHSKDGSHQSADKHSQLSDLTEDSGSDHGRDDGFRLDSSEWPPSEDDAANVNNQLVIFGHEETPTEEITTDMATSTDLHFIRTIPTYRAARTILDIGKTILAISCSIWPIFFYVCSSYFGGQVRVL